MDSVADGIAPAQLISVRGIIAQPNITERAVGAVVVFQVRISLADISVSELRVLRRPLTV